MERGSDDHLFPWGRRHFMAGSPGRSVRRQTTGDVGELRGSRRPVSLQPLASPLARSTLRARLV